LLNFKKLSFKIIFFLKTIKISDEQLIILRPKKINEKRNETKAKPNFSAVKSKVQLQMFFNDGLKYIIVQSNILL
jgi:hypothetical protein